MTRIERQQESDAAAGNSRIATRQLALELLRQGSSLMTMAEAIAQAKAILRQKGGR